ncbi:MAG: hypothetical protein GX267_16310 [Fibrobacter sp.]|jgi:galactokinase/mevalonate kinase-like predicted kinase|nr:hypothetical protein [Fibrobacter sp.]
MSIFNTCIITTFSEKQAEVYRTLIRKRIDHGLYPPMINFLVYADPQDGNIGSGGATILALKRYLQNRKPEINDETILIIHAGKKHPQIPFYAPEGVLFTPLPLPSSSIIAPVVLDLHLSLFLKYPWNRGEVVAISADVIADFDTFELEESRGDICGFAVRAPISKAVNHGVFKFDSYRSNIIDYFQKADQKFLRENALLEGTGECAVDMGIISFSKNFVAALNDTSSIKTTDGKTLTDLLETGSVSFSLYLELITATLLGVDFSSFLAQVSSRSKMPQELLPQFFEVFRNFNLRAHIARSATFLPLSSVPDFFQSCLELRERELQLFYARDFQELQIPDTPDLIVYNSNQFILPVGHNKLIIGESVQNCTLENVMGNNLFIGISNWSSDFTIPEGICIDQRTIDNGNVKIVTGIEDTFGFNVPADQIIFCGKPFKQWLDDHNLTSNEIWDDGEPRNLLHARLFVKNCSDDFLSGYWSKVPGKQWSETFRSSERFSIEQINGKTDPIKQEQLRNKIRCSLLRKQILDGKGWNTTSMNDFTAAFSGNGAIEKLKSFYYSTDNYLLKLYRNRLLEELSPDLSEEIRPSFRVSEKVDDPFRFINQGPGMEKIIIVQCPIRIDLAGGWTDMPPFTLRNGGAVVNFSANLYNKTPVQVFCRKTSFPEILLFSVDKGSREIITDFQKLDPLNGSSVFSLQKSIISEAGFSKKFHPDCPSLHDLLEKIGFGIELTTFCPIAQGSGLGTSSILASTILAALYQLLGRNVDLKEQIYTIIGLEQQLKAGGGWQDLIGGITGGLKLIESKPGLVPDPLIYHLDSSFLSSNLDLFTLYYTGSSTPSDQIMIEASRKMSANIPSIEITLHYLKQLAKDARIALETNNLQSLANIIDTGRRAGNLIFSTNQSPLLDDLLRKALNFKSAVKFTGAGGGGYALFLSPDLQKADALKEYLSKQKENKASVVPFSINERGLEITIM